MSNNMAGVLTLPHSIVFPVLFLVLLASGSARAHLPELFGRDFVLEPASVVATSDVRPSALEMLRDIDELEAELRRREAVAGPYAADLTDPVLQLAVLQARSGNSVAALHSYEQALHVLRVNNGLLHPVQLPILREMAGLYVQIGDLRSGQLAWRYAYRVHGLGSEALSAEALEDALRYFAFARDAYIDPRMSPDHRLFLQAYQDNQELFEGALDGVDGNEEMLSVLGMSYLRNLYILLGTDLSGIQGLSTSGAGSPSVNRLLSLQDLGLGKGREILGALIERALGSAPLEQARLLLARGNWLQWNGRWRGSREDYAAVFAQLDETGAAQVLRDQLATPAELPEDSALWHSLQREETPVRGVVSASYRVSERGDARDVTVEAQGEASSALAGRVSRMLADSHFRPALQAGAGVEALVVGRRYRLID